MADLSPTQRSTLVKNIRETFGLQTDGKKLTFEVDGVSVTIGSDRTITLKGADGGTKEIPGSDFTGRGFTGGMVGVISVAIKEMSADAPAAPAADPPAEAAAPEAAAPAAAPATPAAPAPPVVAAPQRKRRRAMQGDREFSSKK